MGLKMACKRAPKFRDKQQRIVRSRASFHPADIQREQPFKRWPQTQIKSRAELEALVAAHSKPKTV
jgi:hypothetical protein